MDRGFVLWFTGIALQEMTEMARLIETRLLEVGANVELLDSESLGERLFKADHAGHIDGIALAKVAAFAAELLSRNGIISIVNCDASDKAIRQQVRSEVEDFVEVYLKSHKESSHGENFEAPSRPEVEIDIDHVNIETACNQVLKTLEVLGLVSNLTDQDYSEDEEEEVKKRLQDLGYI